MAHASEKEGRTEIAAGLRWAVGYLWAHHRPLSVALSAVVLVRGALPAGLALTARGLINAAAAALRHEPAGPDALLLWLQLGFLVALAEALSHHLNTLLKARMKDRVNTDLTAAVLREAANKPLALFETPGLRESVERARAAAMGRVSSFLESSLVTVTAALQTACLVVVLFSVDPLVIILVGPVSLPFLIAHAKRAKSNYALRRARSHRGRLADYYSGQLMSPSCIPEIRILGIGRLLTDRFEKIARDFQEQDWRMSLKAFTSLAFFSATTVLVFYAVLYRVANRAIQGAVTLGDLAIFGAAAVRLRTSLETAIAWNAESIEHILHINDLRRFLVASPREEAADDDGPPLAGPIEFRGVSFTYPGGGAKVLDNFSITVREGETLALVGRNGAGKTTFVKLLARLYDPDAGAVFVGGQDIRTLPLSRLRASLAVVMQHFGRYEATAGDNIAFGDWRRLEGRPDLVRDIAARTGVSGLIEALPRGYETPVGPSFGTGDFSGGQWQRIALARGFARQAPILVLDEPTAALDAHAELEVYGHYAQLARGKTTILISHRFSTIGMADRIAVLNGGRISEEGTHEELCARGGEYAELYRLHRRWMDDGAALD